MPRSGGCAFAVSRRCDQMTISRYERPSRAREEARRPGSSPPTMARGDKLPGWALPRQTSEARPVTLATRGPRLSRGAAQGAREARLATLAKPRKRETPRAPARPGVSTHSAFPGQEGEPRDLRCGWREPYRAIGMPKGYGCPIRGGRCRQSPFRCKLGASVTGAFRWYSRSRHRTTGSLHHLFYL